MVNHRVDNRVDQCWNQCFKTSIHWRSVNEKSAIKSATISMADVQSDKLMVANRLAVKIGLNL